MREALEYIERIVAQNPVANLRVAVSDGVETCYFAEGNVTTSVDDRRLQYPQFRLGCINKPLLALAAVSLAARGLLDLNESITTYLPEAGKLEKSRSISCRNLLSHTAGYRGFSRFQYPRSSGERAALIRKTMAAETLFRPGDVFSYENSVCVLLEEILSRVTRQQVFELSTEAFPHGIVQSGKDQSVSFAAAAGMSLSIVHLLRLARYVTTDNPNAHLLRRCAVELPRSGAARGILPEAFGLGIALFSGGVVGFDGSTASQVVGFRCEPQRGIHVAIGIDQPAVMLRRIILAGIMQALVGPSNEVLPKPKSLFEPNELSGRYIGNDDMHIDVHTHDAEMEVICHYGSQSPHVSVAKPDRSGRLLFRGRRFGDEPYFFPDPRSNEPCIFMGMSAFKKIGSA